MTNLVQFPGLGLSFEINRVALSIGGFNIYWYGVCIAFGICLALVFAFRHSIEFGVDPDSMVDVILIGIVLGIVSARAYYVAMAPFKYESIWEMIAIRDGGLAIYGGIIGGFLFGGLACKWRGVPVLPMFDLTAMGFLLGQGCGRWGNFFNQEAFGCNTTLPWGMFSEATEDYLMGSTVTVPKGVTIDPAMPVHPTFLYESIWCFVGLALLVAYIKKRKFNGDIALMCAGAGLTTTVFDLINDAGGHPATYVEFGGANYTKAVRTMELCLKTPSKVILVVTFGTIARADVMAQGLVEAIKAHQPKQPIVTCIRGTNEEEAFAILRDAGLEPLTNTEEAVQRAVDIAAGRA